MSQHERRARTEAWAWMSGVLLVLFVGGTFGAYFASQEPVPLWQLLIGLLYGSGFAVWGGFLAANLMLRK